MQRKTVKSGMSNLDNPDHLRKVIKKLKVARVAEASKVTATTIHSFVKYPETGTGTKSFRSDTLAKIKRGIAKLTLEKTNLQVDAELQTNGSGFASVPIYDIRASAGSGSLVEDGEPTGYQPYRVNELARYNASDLAVIQVGGDSMWETLHDGDKVLVNRSEKKIVKPGIYVLSYDGELIVKRCQRNLESGAVIVSSDNPDYETFTVRNAEVLSVIGRVVWIGRALG